MKGHLRIRSERAPYRRADLVWGDDRQLEVAAFDLDGPRLLQLAGDNSLKICTFQGDLGYRPLVIPPDMGSDRAQELLDALSEGATFESATGCEDTGADANAAALAQQLRASQDELSDVRAEVASLRAEKVQSALEIEHLRAGGLGGGGSEAAAALAEQLQASQDALAAARVEIANLRTELAARPAVKPAAPKKK